MVSRHTNPRKTRWSVFPAAVVVLLALSGCAQPEGDGSASTAQKIPITTTSEEAHEAFLEGRHLAESLRATDARPFFERAVELDDDFALAHLALANTAPSAQEFFDSLQQAIDRAAGVSAGEQLMIEAQEAGIKGEPQTQRSALDRLVALHPDDERAQNLLAGFHFGRQEYPAAIRHYVRATEIAPDFPPPYNNLGYAQRFQEKYSEAEETFKTYIQLLPDEPNPYDSYAELLMKLGRFEDSTDNYRNALDKDQNFVASYVGIGTNLMFMGRHEEARETFEQLYGLARSLGERRQAVFGVLASYLFDGDHASALEEAIRLYALAEEAADRATMANDLNLAGNILMDAGTFDEAALRFEEAVRAIELAPVPEEVKERARRNHHYNLARLALASEDGGSTAAHLDQYAAQAGSAGLPFELRRVHELSGRAALVNDDPATALAELEQANQQNPQVLYQMAVACNELGDDERAMELAYKSANWNGLGLDFAYIRSSAQKLVEELDAG